MGKQINYVLNKDLGFRKDAIAFFSVNSNRPAAKKALLLDKLRAIPGIAMVSLAYDPPSTHGMWSSGIDYKDG